MTILGIDRDGTRKAPSPGRRQALAALRAELGRLERGHAAPGTREPPPFGLGVAAIDSVLPRGGLGRAGLHEVTGEEAAALAFCAHLAARRAGAVGLVLWVGSNTGLYGPGLAALGLPPERLLLVRARGNDEILWVLEEALKCRALAAVVGEVRRLDLTASRRLQLAAEAGGACGLLWRPSADGLAASVAQTRWHVASAPSGSSGRADAVGGRRLVESPRLAVRLSRCRGGATGEWILEWRDGDERNEGAGSAAAGAFHLAAPLADRSPRPMVTAAGAGA